MPSDLSPSEREDKESERLIHRRPPPSRKSRPKRGPKHDNRRRRMKVDDPDLRPPSEANRDMSLRSRASSCLLATLSLSARPFIDEKLLSKYERAVEDFLDVDVDEEDLSDLVLRLEEEDVDVDKAFKEMRPWFRRLLDRVKPDSDKGGDGGTKSPPGRRDPDRPEPGRAPRGEPDAPPSGQAPGPEPREPEQDTEPPAPSPARKKTVFNLEGTVSHYADLLQENLGDRNKLVRYLRELFSEIGPVLEPERGSLASILAIRILASGCRSAASNEPFAPVTTRTGAYHGVLDLRGNPTDPPNTEYRSYDRRYFTDEHYGRIVQFASSLLKEDWLKYGWDGGADEARWRAALDLAIHLADDNLYQAKIDAETYDLLLNRLAKLGHDTFSETVLPVRKPQGKRSASAMKQSQAYQNIVRIASDLRDSNPGAALNILKSLRSLVSTEADSHPTISEHAASSSTAGDEAPPAPAEPEQTAASPGDVLEFKSMGDEDFKKLKDELKRESDRLFRVDDVDEFMEGFEKIISDVQKKTAAFDFIPVPILVRLAASSDEARRVLAPVLVAAAKRRRKKGDKKKGDKGGKKAPPFPPKKEDGKSAPPFPPKGGKKSPPKGKKRKASITAEDLNW